MCKTRNEKKNAVGEEDRNAEGDWTVKIKSLMPETSKKTIYATIFSLSTTSYVIRSESRASIDAKRRQTRDLLG